MNFVYITDDNYVIHCGISILSLLENNKGIDDICIYILNNGISDENQKRLSDVCERYGRRLYFIDASDYSERVGFEFNTTGFNSIVLARLFLAEFLPDEIKKIVYLDCDIIVSGDVSGLHEYDLSGKYIAAVPELYMPERNKRELGMQKGETYFNAGMLLINLEMWRREKLARKFMEFYRLREGMLPYNDQDIINYCCKGYVLPLPQKYNMSPNLPFFPRWFMVRLQPGYKTSTVKEYRDMIDNPCIVHYLGDERPWINGNKNYYRGLYEKYKSMTVWADAPLVKGREWYMFCYHLLNILTIICPWGRVLFSNFIGINVYKWFKKK